MSDIDLSALNEGQRRIVTTLDEPLFVEAGAGSGKTFTLTQRVVWALSPGSGEDGRPFLDDLSQVLVITFTNAAAREIKERVRSTLRAAGMREAALQVDSAWISTIHGMCSRILRRYALDLGIDPEFRVASTNEEAELTERALEEVVGGAVRAAAPGSPLDAAVAEYGFGVDGPSGPSGLLGLVSGIVAAGKAAPKGLDSLELAGTPDVAGSMRRVTDAVASLAAQRGLSKKAVETLAASTEALAGYEALAPGRQDAAAAVEALAKVRLPAKAKALGELLPDAKRALAEARCEAALARVSPLAAPLVELARKVDARYAELKRARSLLDNDDLVTLALEAVRDNRAVADAMAGRFRLVMVDEFQDTDTRQLELIGILSGQGAQHLATVGDAQQSIYRFRGADVSVFRGRGRELPASGHVRLDTNYRSHRDVLSLVDRVCGGPAGLVDGFMHLEDNPDRKDGYRARTLPRIDIEVTSGRSRVSKQQAGVMAAAIADRLAAYRDAGERPGDMALLLGVTTNAALYIDALRARGLECVVTGGSTFTSAPEVQAMGALLHTLANRHDTQSGLFPLLTSGMFDLDADDLVQLGTRRQRELDAPTKRRIDRGMETMEFFHGARPSRRLELAYEVLRRARSELRRRPVADVCLQVVRDSGWLSRLEGQGTDGRAQEANVLAAVRYIRDLTEELGLGPARAAQEFDRWLAEAKVPPASLSGGETAAVRIMTVHASKGLEFPVVAVAECWTVRPGSASLATGLVGSSQELVLAPKGGVDARDEAQLEVEERPETLGEWFRALRARATDEEDAERTRLLYVALTRAREALVLGISCYESKAGLSPALASGAIGALFGAEPPELPPVGASRLEYGGSEPAYVRHVHVEKARGAEHFVADAGGAFADVEGELPDDPAQVATMGHGEGAAGDGRAAFAIYPLQDDLVTGATRMSSARTDVFSYSSAHEQLRASYVQAGGGGVPSDTDGVTPLPTRVELDAEDEGAPAASDADRATSFGSAFHELAQGMVETGRHPAPERIGATADRWRLSERNRDRLVRALERWWGCDLRREVLGHDHVRAEVPFFAQVEGTGLARYGHYVEGAIDLLATDDGSDHALLVDYKTGDRGLSAEAIRARHEMQAGFYASVLMGQGYTSVSCRFVCVELEAEDGGPYVVRYDFG